VSEPPKLNVTATPVFLVKAGPAALYASVNDAAAYTMIFFWLCACAADESAVPDNIAASARQKSERIMTGHSGMTLVISYKTERFKRI
jgi:hypothetical protein